LIEILFPHVNGKRLVGCDEVLSMSWRYWRGYAAEFSCRASCKAELTEIHSSMHTHSECTPQN